MRFADAFDNGVKLFQHIPDPLFAFKPDKMERCRQDKRSRLSAQLHRPPNYATPSRSDKCAGDEMKTEFLRHCSWPEKTVGKLIFATDLNYHVGPRSLEQALYQYYDESQPTGYKTVRVMRKHA